MAGAASASALHSACCSGLVARRCNAQHAVFDDVSCPAMSRLIDSWTQSSTGKRSANRATNEVRSASGASSAAEARIISTAVSR